jgi:hypothetical protein
MLTTSNNRQKQLLMVILFIFVLELLAYLVHFFICLPSFNERLILETNMAHQYHFLCPLYNHVEALHVIIMNECLKFHLSIIFHP